MIFLLFGHEYAFLFGDGSTASGPEYGLANLWNLGPPCKKSRAIAKMGPPDPERVFSSPETMGIERINP